MASPASPSHKPRKKPRQHSSTTSLSPTDFPLVSFLWPAKVGNRSPWLVIPLILMVAAVFRWATTFWPYSGLESPPMHGDFEAQRHWMELTIHLSPLQWYFYDLQWWGLDYPPLTAYHSWVLGMIGNYIEPSWFELVKSRGLDDPMLKLYMRSTVLASEYLIYIPAIVSLVRRLSRLEGVSIWESFVSLTAILMLPSVILIDHGHFQYNTVMLGLAAATTGSLLAQHLRLACFFFVGSLGFKQMGLFYAPAVFAYLLGQCVFPRLNLLRFLSIAITTVLSFGMLFAPLLLAAAYDVYRGQNIEEYVQPPFLSALPLPFEVDPKNILHVPLILLAQSVHRIFPFARGLFEDKVANVWCAIHTFHKLHQYPSQLVQRAALAGTSLAILPPCLILFFKPRRDLLPLGLATCAWGFFLLSYQVHEKNILLPILPMSFLLATRGGLSSKHGGQTRAWVGFANFLAAWTMFPLLKRDGLTIPYFVLVGLWQWLLGLLPFSFSAYLGSQGVHWFQATLHGAFYAFMFAWHIVEAWVPPPNGKPDLWIVVNVLIGAAGFGLCYLWCFWGLLTHSGLVKHSHANLEEKKTQ